MIALLKDGSACVEMARASGLALVPSAQRDALRATSHGTGDIIAAALKRGVKRIVVGLGGTASSDGGAGMAQALGARLLDARGRELRGGVSALLALDRIDASALKTRLRGVTVIGISDVTNPLLGSRGSAAVYGPQKGATPAQVLLIEKALTHYARLLKRDLGKDVASVPGAGAAGGFGAGLLAFLDGTLLPGAAFVLDACGARRRLKAADAVLTGEGRLDATSFYGKAPIELAHMARKIKVPVALACGQIEANVRPLLRAAGVCCVVTLAEAGATKEQSLREAARWAAKAAAHALKGLALVAAAAGFIAAGSLSDIDALYFRRNEPGKLDQCLKELEGAKEPAAQWRLARGLIRRGERQTLKKDKLADFQAAEDAGQRAVTGNPNVAEAHFWLGLAHGRQGQIQGMMKSLFLVGPIRREMEAALKLDPHHGGAHHVLGELLWQLPGFVGGDKKRALAEFEAALKLSPRYSANYAPLAEAYLKLGRIDDARRVLEQLDALKEPADPAQFPDDLKDADALRSRLRAQGGGTQ